MYLNASDIQKRLKVSRTKAYLIMHEIGIINVGRSVRVHEDDFDTWEKSQVKPGQSSKDALRKSLVDALKMVDAL